MIGIHYVASWRRGVKHLDLTRRRYGATKSEKKKLMTENEIVKHAMDAALLILLKNLNMASNAWSTEYRSHKKISWRRGGVA